jgi:hypothetical protein
MAIRQDEKEILIFRRPSIFYLLTNSYVCMSDFVTTWNNGIYDKNIIIVNGIARNSNDARGKYIPMI